MSSASSGASSNPRDSVRDAGLAQRAELDQLRKGQISSCLTETELRKVADGTYAGDDPIIKLPPAQRKLVAGIIVSNAYQLPLTLAPYTEFFTDAGLGQWFAPDVIPGAKPGTNTPVTPTPIKCAPKYQQFVEGQLIVARSTLTGSLVTAFVVPPPPQPKQPSVPPKIEDIFPLVTILDDDNLPANAMPAPKATAANNVPTGTQRIFVEYAEYRGLDGLRTNTGMGIYHEQYWRPSTSSFPLAPFERKKIVLVQQTGMTSTSSTEEQVEKNLSLGVSVGWGAFAASISASFSASSRTSSSRTLSQMNESTTEITIENCRKESAMVVYWELVDAFTFVKEDKIRAGIESVQAPLVVQLVPEAEATQTCPPIVVE